MTVVRILRPKFGTTAPLAVNGVTYMLPTETDLDLSDSLIGVLNDSRTPYKLVTDPGATDGNIRILPYPDSYSGGRRTVTVALNGSTLILPVDVKIPLSGSVQALLRDANIPFALGRVNDGYPIGTVIGRDPGGLIIIGGSSTLPDAVRGVAYNVSRPIIGGTLPYSNPTLTGGPGWLVGSISTANYVFAGMPV